MASTACTALGPLGVRFGEHLAQAGGHHLPGRAEPVLRPPAAALLTAGAQRSPQAVGLVLDLAGHSCGDQAGRRGRWSSSASCALPSRVTQLPSPSATSPAGGRPTPTCCPPASSQASLWAAEDNPRAHTSYRRNGFVPDGARKVVATLEDLPEVRLVR